MRVVKINILIVKINILTKLLDSCNFEFEVESLNETILIIFRGKYITSITDKYIFAYLQIGGKLDKSDILYLLSDDQIDDLLAMLYNEILNN